MKRIRIFLIEDNRILLAGIRAIINAQEDMRVVAAEGGGNNVLLQIRRTKPGILLLDVGLREQNGLRIMSSIAEEFPNVKVIGMGLTPSQSDIVKFVEAGASGFVLKDAAEKDFLAAIRSVAGGMKVLPPLLIGSLFSHVVDYALREGKANPASAIRMTKREGEVIELIADGLSNKEIGRMLNIATHTVKSHVHNILQKLTLRTRLQISAYAQHEEPL